MGSHESLLQYIPKIFIKLHALLGFDYGLIWAVSIHIYHGNIACIGAVRHELYCTYVSQCPVLLLRYDAAEDV